MTTSEISKYWMARGVGYQDESRLQSQFYRDQERLVIDTVKRFRPNSIFEAGCGFGRITKALASAMPDTMVQGMDLSPDQIVHAIANTASQHNAQFRQGDLYAETGFPSVDVALAIEVFLHHPSEAVEAFADRLLLAAPVLIHDVDLIRPTAEHCFFHDYLKIYRSLGADCEFVSHGEHSLMVVKRVA